MGYPNAKSDSHVNRPLAVVEKPKTEVHTDNGLPSSI